MASVIISTITSPTSNALTFSGLSLSGYRIITLRVDGLTVGTDDAEVLLQVSQSGSWLTGASDYAYVMVVRSTGGSTEDQSSTAASSIRLTDPTANWSVGNAAGEVFSARIELVNRESGMPRQFTSTGAHVGPTGNCVLANGVGHINNSTELDGFRIVLDAGTMPTGRAIRWSAARGRDVVPVSAGKKQDVLIQADELSVSASVKQP